ncbi:uncharacterized protein TRIADDRAFT_62020 [Trichoplax adhaerens]|uniref:Nucleolar protein 12 n=1 Tax=Trichoplax adhaerens TaxID=10228 RepID=B3SCL8_TRIAD|nr:predicted protein [Trichoplax adhaerens]EDV19562.1 predicted protein [Trichoplax adhaerens]|eukprot:XP_002117994.1 predicted protein [Trichoplax adhaerens]
MKGKSKKSKRDKLILTFDEDSRRDYLTGFRKRKNMRRKKAKEQEEKLKKDCIRNAKQKKKKELEQKLHEREQRINEIIKAEEENDDSTPVTYNYPDHFVTVTTIGDVDLNPDDKQTASSDYGHNEVSNRY